MAFVEADRVQLRRWLGYAPIFNASNPFFEAAISSVQSTTDGGSRPDNTTELAIKVWLVELSTIETNWKALYQQLQAYKLSDLTVDPLRGLAGLFKIGRMYVGHISDALSCSPMRDVFSAPDITGSSHMIGGG